MQKIVSKREKAIFYITVGIIIFSVAFNFFIAPVLKRVETLNKETDIIRRKLKKYIRLLSQKDYLQDKYNKFASGQNLSNVDTDTSVSAISILQALAKDANIHIIELRPQASGNLKGILTDLRTEGTIEDYLKFIYNIENSLMLLRIKRFQLNAKSNTQALEGSFSILQPPLD